MAVVASGRAVTADLIEQYKAQAPVIATHNATHHADEVIATNLLRLLPEYSKSCIVRTRDQALLDLCDVVVDNGGEYNAEKNRYDHHQQTFGETWSEMKKNTRLSSAGLVWRHFGKRLLQEVLRAKPEEIDFLHEEIYDLIFESIDANDNGVRSCECKVKAFTGGMPSLGARIAHENTSWCHPDKQDESICFQSASKIADQDLTRQLQLLATHLPGARDALRASLARRFETHPSGKIVELQDYTRFYRFLRRYDTDVCDSRVEVVIMREGDESECEWRAHSLGRSFKHMEQSVTFPVPEKERLPRGLIYVTPAQVVAKDKASLMEFLNSALTADQNK